MSMSTTNIQDRLAEIARAMTAGAPASRFQAEMDTLLETTMEERNREVEASWQEIHGPKDLSE